ncbi:MAG: tRNA-dihydrouridine synthase [Chromatiales bacterium]|nr:tRNA-dihydrouridine synthase [Chromatiales bacterium]
MRILLAPMEGLLDHRLRDILTQPGGAAGSCGIDACVTEFIRITSTLLPAERFHRVVPELRNRGRTPAGVPVRVQFLGSDPACLAENAALAAMLGAPVIDLNFGCPARLVNRHGGGAALLRDPGLMRAIVHAVRQAVPAAIPVTAKMRLGYDTPDVALDCARALADGGAAEIVVHARTRTDGYRPPAYWEWIASIREHVRIPVIANGEIWTVDDARRCRAVSGCDDLMLGRGAVANPALALMIRGDRDTGFAWPEVREMLRRYWAAIGLQMPERHRHGRLKQWLLHLARHYPEARDEFGLIRRLVRPEDISGALFPEFNATDAIPVFSSRLAMSLA